MLLRFLSASILFYVCVPDAAYGQFRPYTSESLHNSQQGNWIHEYPLPGVSPEIDALATDGEHVFVGGLFHVAGSQAVHGVASYSIKDQLWTAIAQELSPGGRILALAVGLDGSLYAGGNFTMINGVEANGIARYDFDKEVWSDLHSGVNGIVRALEVGPDGTLYVGGSFTTTGGVSAANIAAWINGEWDAIGNTNGDVRILMYDGTHLYVGGSFSIAGQTQANGIARFDMDVDEWTSPGNGVDGSVFAMASTSDYIYVGGSFGNAIQIDGSTVASQNAAKWNRLLQEWESADIGIHQVASMVSQTNGTVYTVTTRNFLRTVETGWEAIGLTRLPLPEWRIPSFLISNNDRIVVGFRAGYPLDFRPSVAQFLYSFDPVTGEWGVFPDVDSGGVDQLVGAFASDDHGGLYVGGHFSFAGRTRADNVAFFSSDDLWETLGGGVAGSVHSLMVDNDAMVYVGGSFHGARQETGQLVPSKHVAAWSPAENEWRPMGFGVSIDGPVPPIVRTMAEDVEGSVLIAGYFASATQPDGSVVDLDRIARWRPEQEEWESLPDGHGLVDIYSVAVDVAGTTYAGGYAPDDIGTITGRISRLQPGATEWETIGAWPAGTTGTLVPDLVVWGNPGGVWGGIYAVVYGDGIWHWDGTEWSSLGGPQFGWTITRNGLPSGGGVIYVGTELNPFTAPDNEPGPWQWDGVEWIQLGGGVDRLDDGMSSPARIYALHAASHSDGTASLWVGGFFSLAGGQPSASLARWLTQDYGLSTDQPPVAVQPLHLAVFPNPAGSVSTVEFELPMPAEVRVEVYDLLGRRVMTLLDEERLAGTHRLHLPSTSLASGTYVVRLSAGNESRAVLMTRVE